jgi:hypothetical protein
MSRRVESRPADEIGKSTLNSSATNSSATVWTLWEDARFVVTTSANPHLPAEEGRHLIVAPKDAPPHAWADPAVTAAAFELTARVCQVLERLGLGDWFNVQRLCPQARQDRCLG